VPPMHSALKLDGKPLYAYARAGVSVERAPRRVRVDSIRVIEGGGDRWTVEIACSKGTYVRTLAEDIGAALGCGAHLAALRRTGSGRFRVDDAVPVAALETMAPPERRARVIGLEALLVELPRVDLDAALAAKLRNGQSLSLQALSEGVSAVYGPDGALIGIGRAEAGTLHPLRLTQVAEKG